LTIRQRLGGRRDSAAQISGASPPSTSPPPNRNRRRSSLAQLTDILREWSGGTKRTQKPPLNRRETLADLARSLPWHRVSNDQHTNNNTGHAPPIRKRRESSADSGIKSMRSRRDSHTSDVAKFWNKKDLSSEKEPTHQEIVPSIATIPPEPTTPTPIRNGSRRGSGDSSYKASRRDSLVVPPPKVIGVQKKRRDSLAAPEIPNFRQEQRPSTSSAESGPLYVPQHVDSCTGSSIPMPTIITSSVSPTSPKYEIMKSGRRDSTTQCRINRRESRLQRQATAYDESCTPSSWSRRGSQSQQTTQVSPSGDNAPNDATTTTTTTTTTATTSLYERQARRDSLSPDINSAK
jgi:hypothetical protein